MPGPVVIREAPSIHYEGRFRDPQPNMWLSSGTWKSRRKDCRSLKGPEHYRKADKIDSPGLIVACRDRMGNQKAYVRLT